ncbi:uncharacterized protein LOC124372157, partial [Homalodisca vitripennis]|uniref:uncharacterized protein LOC124372157 n=1 Tax=Homalodisca vitripennis TaxID=197043 RepID=UPI001EEA1D95
VFYNDLVYDFKKGESWSNIGQCLLHRCKGDNQVIVERCPNVTLHRGCTLSKEDPTKYFPGCCPYPLCDETEAVMCVDAQDRSRHAPGDQWQPSGECVSQGMCWWRPHFGVQVHHQPTTPGVLVLRI